MFTLVDPQEDKQSGFEDDDFPAPCLDTSHNPPLHLYIPPGKIYRHVCPSCFHTLYTRPAPIFFSNSKS